MKCCEFHRFDRFFIIFAAHILEYIFRIYDYSFWVNNRLLKLQEQTNAPAIFIVLHPKWILLRMHSAPYRPNYRSDIHNMPAHRSLRRYHRKGTAAAGKP